MNLNKAIIAGNLTREPELKSLPSGVKVATFSLATNRFWKDQATGENKQASDYHNIVVFGRQAETSAQFLKQGQSALVEGRLQTRSWEGQDGKKNYRTEIVADRVQFGSKSGAADSSGSAPTQNFQSPTSAGASEPTKAPEVPTIEYPTGDINPEDIPF
jgi:single-strand DNA-binding protein